MEFESKSTMPSILAPPSKMKFLGINLIKCVQELHEKNYKDLREEKRTEQRERYFLFMERKTPYC